MMLKTLIAPLAVAAALFATPSQASLIGNTIDLDWGVTGSTTSLFSGSATISDPGVEFPMVAISNVMADFTANALSISFDLGAFPNVGGQTTFAFTGFDSQITGVTQTGGPSSDVAGVNFTDTSITIDLLDFGVPPQVRVFTFDVGTAVNVVPLPATLPLLAVGFLGLGLAGRRRKAAQA